MRDSKLYKVLRIIFLTLAIISLVFALAKKVGLAASSGFSLPYYAGRASIPNYVDISIVESYVKSSSGISDFTSSNYHIFAKFSENNTYAYYDYYVIYGADTEFYITSGSDYSVILSVSQANSINSSSNRVCLQSRGAALIERYRVTYNKSDLSLSNNGRQAQFSIWTMPVPDTSDIIYYLNQDILYTSSDISSSTPSPSPGAVIMSKGSGHSQGGVLADPEVDWGAIDDVLNTTQLIADTVDNTWTNFTFWQRILVTLTQGFNNFVHIGQWLLNNLLSFFKPVFDSILNVLQWFVTFFNNLLSALTDFFESILDFVENGFQSVVTAISSLSSSISGFFTDIYDDISGFFAHLHEIYEWIYNHGLDSDREWSFIVLFHYLFDFDTQTALTDFQNNKYGDFILDSRDFFVTVYESLTTVTPSEHVFFTIQLGNHFGIQIPDIQITFDWYASVRDKFLPVLFAFIYVGAVWLFLKRLPDIIHGVASAESSFLDSIGGDEFAPTSHGVFTSGVSKNQPSLDKNPISGSGGVHSGSSQFWY